MAKSDYEAVDHKPNLLRHKDVKNGSYACRIMINGKTIWLASS